MESLTVSQVEALAPDTASLKAGQGLANSRHWTGLGGSNAGLWGECKGSGKEPYKVRVDLSNNGSDCSCPSRKFPCKHVLGLMLMAANSPGNFSASTSPGWVSEWLEKRAVRQQAPAKTTEPESDPAVRQKEAASRAAKREKLAENGLDALERWLKDMARQGLAFAQAAPSSYWDEQAARMIDAKLPGAARMIHEMAALPGSRPDWDEILLLRMGRLYLLAQAYRKLETLPEASYQDVRTLLGWSVNQDELLATTPGLQDDWLVLASQTQDDEKTGLRTQVNWLFGKNSQRIAQITNFAFRTLPIDTSLIPGISLRGELVYFPGAFPLRAVFKEKHISASVFEPGGCEKWPVFLDAYSAALGLNPWLDVFPAVLAKGIPAQVGQGWFLRDVQGQALPLALHFRSPWELFALAGGTPLTVFGLWDGFTFLPLTAWIDNRVIWL